MKQRENNTFTDLMNYNRKFQHNSPPPPHPPYTSSAGSLSKDVQPVNRTQPTPKQKLFNT